MPEQDPELSAHERAMAERIRIVKLAGQERYLARSRTVEPGAYYELTVAWGRVRCSCPGFTYRAICKHVAALEARLAAQQARAESRAQLDQEAS